VPAAGLEVDGVGARTAVVRRPEGDGTAKALLRPIAEVFPAGAPSIKRKLLVDPLVVRLLTPAFRIRGNVAVCVERSRTVGAGALRSIEALLKVPRPAVVPIPTGCDDVSPRGASSAAFVTFAI
jgi:hypothetical protein